MGLASALSTALTGLSAAETTIDVVGNNLANANTVAFKASDANFANQFLRTQSLGSGPTDTSGGSNPRQIGLGTMVADITPNFSQGTIEISSNPTDMAIQGDGFFIVEGQGTANAYTRNGIFKMNADSQLTTITGNRLLGYGVDNQFEIQTTSLEPIDIPIGSLTVAKATENVSLQGTLSPTGTIADAAKIIQSNILGDASYTYPTTLPAREVSGAPNISTLSFTPDNSGTGSVATGHYSYKLVFTDKLAAPPDNTLEGTPSSASVDVNVTTPSTVDITGFNALPRGNYSYVNVYRATVTAGVIGDYKYLNTASASAAVFHDTYASGSTDVLNDTVLADAQYYYYVAFGKTGSESSRPSEKIGPLQPVGGRIHISDLPSAGANPNGWDSWIIYRNAPTRSGGANRYFELTQIPFTSTTPSFTDKVPDINIYTDDTTHEPEIDLDGPKAQRGTLLTNVIQRDGADYNLVFPATGTISFQGRKGGIDLAERNLTLTPLSTVGDFSLFMEQSLGIQESTSTNGIPDSVDVADETASPIPPGFDVIGGKIQLTGNNGTGNAIDIKSLTGTNTNLPFTTYQDARGESAASDLTVYDSLGIACTARLTAVLESSGAATTYRWFADSKDNLLSSGDPTIAVGTGLISFDGQGNFISATQNRILINRQTLPSDSPLQVDLDFSKISGLDTTTSTLSMKDQDGSAPGVLTSFIVGEDGLIRGVFSNGVTRNLGQIRLVRFGNPAGLEQLGENLYTTGVNSGLPVEGNPGQQGIGSIVSGAVELSNADVGTNLIDLILASTMYRSNTRVISTVQQMLDTLLQLQR